MKTKREYAKLTYLGIANGEKIYLSAPSWDCGWYWGFGYLGNENCHYHVDGLTKIETYNHETKAFTHKNVDLHEGFIQHFGSSFIVRKSDIWVLAELFKTFYTLKETCEVLGRGGSHYATNPCAEIIQNKDEVTRINNLVLPAIFDAIYDVLDWNSDNGNLFKELVKLNNLGDTLKVVNFMNKYSIHTDDIKDLEGITAHDYNIIHSKYWEIKHSKK